ncbi:MAG: DUF1553 domain-containing protein, partial [Verrucomicrobiae bacterium]|nr:DUF1553 domain-containing protein [Verrucomicrobiae bacterium]
WLWQPPFDSESGSGRLTQPFPLQSVADSSAKLDTALAALWQTEKVEPLPRADDLAIARRLSLALTGSIPSMEQIRAFESRPDSLRVAWWIDQLLSDKRSADYLAERFARAFVGTENGPFLVYRRLALTRWLSDQFEHDRPYDEVVRDLISAEGLWTTNPAANFITATIDNNNKKEGPDQIRLAIRTTRAFLGVRIDCVQCHDDKFGDRWKQQDFHQLAAYYAGAQMKFTGVRDNRNLPHEVRFRGDDTERTVLPAVPFSPELLPDGGRPRERLAAWVTSPENLPFARATVNRVWAILFGRPIVEPIDDIPLEPAEVPEILETLAKDFVAHDFDLQRLISVIALSRAYQLDSHSPDPDSPATASQEQHWAAFPLTRLRPEQIAGSVIQAASLDSIDGASPFILQFAKFAQTNEFVKRYGDLGETEFEDRGGTIPQRLLMMNGKLVQERIGQSPFINATTRIMTLAPDSAAAVDAAYLCVFTRRPTVTERDHFAAQLSEAKGRNRHRVIEDLFWTLMNSSEFAWNH